MTNTKRQANEIKSRYNYLSLFPDDKETIQENTRYLALKEALDIRKFEIELNWKRTAFFWAFITVIYAALFAVICKYVEFSEKYYFLVPVISTLSGLGFFFSVAWHNVNKGSKFWQKNWEAHVSLLERDLIGPLYDVYLNPKGSLKEKLCPTSAYDFSVSKINMWGSFTVVLCSLGCWIGVLCWLWNKVNTEFKILIEIISMIILILILLMIFLSNGNNDIEITNSDNSDLNMIHLV
ncbi:MAG: hypothetical protein IJU92_08085 [Spirochaetaceae bacterium]|nr:hypothetical protein [Spirochaetaceae bacterium]